MFRTPLPWRGSENTLDEYSSPSVGQNTVSPSSVPGPVLGARETDNWASSLPGRGGIWLDLKDE